MRVSAIAVAATNAAAGSQPRIVGWCSAHADQAASAHSRTLAGYCAGAAFATAATVTVRTTYQCQPKTGQAPEPQAVQDIFMLRKVGGEWLIDSTGMMDNARRR